jgi:hypothetical protein
MNVGARSCRPDARPASPRRQAQPFRQEFVKFPAKYLPETRQDERAAAPQPASQKLLGANDTADQTSTRSRSRRSLVARKAFGATSGKTQCHRRPLV